MSYPTRAQVIPQEASLAIHRARLADSFETALDARSTIGYYTVLNLRGASHHPTLKPTITKHPTPMRTSIFRADIAGGAWIRPN